MSFLSQEQLERFHAEGCLVLEDFVPTETLGEVMEYSHELLRQFDPAAHPLTKFSTDDADHVGDHYFLDLSDQVSYFLDTDAVNSDGTLNRAPERAVNKVGHGLHLKAPACRKLTYDPRVVAIAAQLGFQDPRVLQLMLIFKHPNHGKTANAVPPHTDGAFLYTDPLLCIGFWYALEDCTLENGCLHYLPGSHKQHTVGKRFVRVVKDGTVVGTTFEPVGSPDVFTGESLSYTSVPCPAGLLVLIHHSVLHKSEDNVSERSRFAYTFHVIEGPDATPAVEYDAKNWLQIPSNSRAAGPHAGAASFARLETPAAGSQLET